MYSSQWEQDKWLNENIFKNKKNGYTEMLSGIEETYNNKRINRTSEELKIKNGASTTIDVNCYRIDDILANRGITHVDYIRNFFSYLLC